MPSRDPSAGGTWRVTSTRISRLIRAPRTAFYRALLDPLAVAKWKMPAGMTAYVHEVEPREGGGFRVSLTTPRPRHVGALQTRTSGMRRSSLYRGSPGRSASSRRSWAVMRSLRVSMPITRVGSSRETTGSLPTAS
jgi:hypothetical protein